MLLEGGRTHFNVASHCDQCTHNPLSQLESVLPTGRTKAWPGHPGWGYPPARVSLVGPALIANVV
jgi:hypothetical protein